VSGEPLLLLHGGGGTWHLWEPALPLLAGRHNVLALTLQGHWGGPPPPADGSFGLVTMADEVERALDERGWVHPHVAGGSLGGWVALELARRGRAHTTVGIAPGGGWAPGGLFWHWVTVWYVAMNRLARLQAHRARCWVRRPRLRRLLTWHHFVRADRLSPQQAAHLLESMAHTDGMEEAVASSRDWDVGRDLQGIACPVLLAFPERDYVLPWRFCGRRLVTAIPHAERTILRGVGHAAMVDDPELVARTILGFARRRTDAGRAGQLT